MLYYNVGSSVPLPPSQSLSFTSVGDLHNYFLGNLCLSFYGIGPNQDYQSIKNACKSWILAQQQANFIPSGSSTIFDGVVNVLDTSTSISQIVSGLTTIYNDTHANQTYVNTPLMAYVAVALRSANFWKDAKSGETNPEAPQAFWMIILTIIADVAGAIAGAKAGADVADMIGVDRDTGAVIGAIAGAVTASATMAMK